ncbi:MAG: metallophosphoesterase, partial [Roseimicrobium sp.]
SFMSVESRRRFIARFKTIYAPMMLSGSGSYAYGSLLERHRLTVERHDLRLALGARAPERFRAVSLTDFHFDPLYEMEFLQECVNRTNELKPDVVLLSGDYISRTSRRIDDFSRVLSGLSASAGVFACLGNHDHWDRAARVAASLSRQGVAVLQNQHTRVPCAGGELIITGLQSAWGGWPNWGLASRGVLPKDRVLALMHEPDFADVLALDNRIAFQVSGHTHGGQIRLPGIGALQLPTWGLQYQAGFYDVGGLKLYVNRGIGTIRHHIRIGCPPEIACFDITNADVSGATSQL